MHRLVLTLLLCAPLCACPRTELPEASTGEVTDPDDGPTRLGLEKMLDHRLRQAHLSVADLAEHPASAAQMTRYREASAGGDLATARAAHASLLAHLDVVAADAQTQTRKAARLRRWLEAEGPRLPEARREAVRSHIETLSSQSASDLRRRSLDKLERELARLGR